MLFTGLTTLPGVCGATALLGVGGAIALLGVGGAIALLGVGGATVDFSSAPSKHSTLRVWEVYGLCMQGILH